MNRRLLLIACLVCVFFCGPYMPYSACAAPSPSTTPTPSATPATTGSFTKVVQRVPVKILLDPGADAVLHPSLSSTPPSIPQSVAATLATLHWTNGETICGDFLEATGSSVTWQSPLFEQPLVLDWNVISRVDWPAHSDVPSDPFAMMLGKETAGILAGKSATPPDSFFISLRDGSALYGDLAAITGSSVLIHGARYGDVTLNRADVLSARRVTGKDLILAGPSGAAGWQEMEVQQNGSIGRKNSGSGGKDAAPAFVSGPFGTLETPYWNRAALLAMQAHGALDVEFHLHTTARPKFRLSVNAGPGTALRIETWDDALVAALPNESDFTLIRKIDDTEHGLALRFCWDPKSRRCMVFTAGGELIADWQAPEDHSQALPGVLVENKGHDLTLDYLRIRKWDGSTLPPKADVNRPRVEIADGRILSGEVTSGSGGSILLTGSAGERVESFALKDVDGLLFSSDTPADAPAKATLTYADGTYLKGQISAIKDGKVTLATSFSPQPLVAGMDGLRQLLIDQPEAAPPPAMATLDTLTIGPSKYHGTLMATGSASPQWLPVGGLAPVTPSGTNAYEIKRFFPPDAPPSDTPALIYTRAGDILPGDMHALDRAGVEFDSGITEATKLSASAIAAIQFGASAGRTLHGFNDAGWRILKGDESKVRREGNSLELDPGAVIGNASAMQSSEIRFGMTLEGNLCSARLRMFCAGTDPAKSTNLLLAANGNSITCGLEAMEGQWDGQPVQATSPSGNVTVRLVIEEKGVEIYLNGLSVSTVPVPASTRQGAGLIIEPASLWGNPAQGIKLTDFSMRSQRGSTWLPDVPSDAKTQALTIPRFQRNDPPAHALIAANGDILRGEIEGATITNFGFRAGMQELTVPRDRVKAVVWLGKPAEAPPAAAPEDPGKALLDEELTQNVTFGETNLRSITRYFQMQNPKLKFKLPENNESMVPSFSTGHGTIASMLDRVCDLCGMTYHVDDKGVIVIEPPGAAQSAAMVKKMYWLKPGSLSATDPQDKILASLVAKGVPFPPGATAAWNAGAAQLTVQNTPENQAHLAQALAPDFAGAIGSPTHWLVLASGARLALAVDKFGKDTITGWHPLYGHCAIPTTQVALVRTSPTEPTAAMKAVNDWHTVYAPEPVLPEAGGDSSASIGKAAADFKLPLLDGGTFQLAQEKGKIVVLDFWATWCGPCVHSLPGLIQSMSAFPADRVRFVGVNQDEPAAQVKQFLDTRGWKLAVALDDGSHVGQQYGADAIPLTVIIGPDGKIAWVKSGSAPDEEGDAAAEVTKLLAAPSPQAN